MRDKLVRRVAEFPVKSEIGTLRGYVRDTVRRRAAHGVRVRPHRRRQERARAAASRDIIRDVFGGAHPVHLPAALQAGGTRRPLFLRDGAAGMPTQAIPQDGGTESEVARSRRWREVG